MTNQIGQEVLNVPFPEMVQKLALGIAESQYKLDESSIRLIKTMSETIIDLPGISNPASEKESVKMPLIAMGLFPGFYRFQEAEIEVKLAITMANSTEIKVGAEGKVGYGPICASVNASYAAKYDYKAEGASSLRMRMVQVPPPPALQEYMETLIEKWRADIIKAKMPAPLPPVTTPV